MNASEPLQHDASLDPQLAAMVGGGAAAATLYTAGNPKLLSAAETQYLGHVSRKRAAEFAAGRLCARRAMQEFGVSNFSLLGAADRTPIWPPLLTGSISHTENCCFAVVVGKRQFRSVGVDAERIDAVTQDLWPTICVQREMSWLNSLSPAEAQLGAAIIYCAKEAYYKCQFSVLRQWLDFKDVIVEIDTIKRQSQFTAAVRHTNQASALQPTLSGRYQIRQNIVCACIAWSREMPAPCA